MFFMDKNAVNITAITNSNYIFILRIVARYYSQHLFDGDPAYIMEDKVTIHPAYFSLAACLEYSISSRPWPTLSLNLNLVGAVWHKMKYFLYHMDEGPITEPTSRVAVEAASRNTSTNEI